MRRKGIDFCLNASNIAALLLVALVSLEVIAALALILAHAFSGVEAPPGLCRSLALLWPDRDTTVTLLDSRVGVAGIVLCATNLLPRLLYVPYVLFGLVWMVTYWLIRVEQTRSPLVFGDDFIRLFVIAIGVVKFRTSGYLDLAAGTASATPKLVTYLLIVLIQVLVIFCFQRRLNEITHIASRT